MAGDLIPPPSPAGRPPPDPEFEPIPEPPGGEPDAAATPETSPSLPPSPYRGRFGFVTGVLLGCGDAAAVLLLVVITSGGPKDEGLARDWSTWKPDTNDSFIGADEIAKHVQGTYRNEKKKPLASVTSGPIAFGQIPLIVAIPAGDNVQPLYGTGVQYTLGGSGKEGLLKDSKPSKARHRLLRREALELALYSFRYLDDITMVAIALPAATKKDDTKQSRAVFYRPGDLLPQLQVPLAKTLSPVTPHPKSLTKAESARVDSLVLRNLFESSIQPLDSRRRYLVLSAPEIVDGS